MSETVAQRFAATLEAMRNCERSGNSEWETRHLGTLNSAERDYLPSGSGFDDGTRFDHDKSNVTRLVFHTSFHHMNDVGMYDGWSDHTVTVTPTFSGVDVRVSGRDRNDIKDYIAEVFYDAMTQHITR